MATSPPIPGSGTARLPRSNRSVPGSARLGRPPGGEQFRDINMRFASGVGINWIGMEAFMNMVNGLDEGIQVQMGKEAHTLAAEMERYAKDNAPWNDVTGDARAELQAQVVVDGRDVSIYLMHGVHYGVYLENADGGKNAIIAPTVEKFSQELGARAWTPTGRMR